MKITVTYTLKEAGLGIENSGDLDQGDEDAVQTAAEEQLSDMLLADPEDFLSDIKFEEVEATLKEIEFEEDEITFED